MNSDILFFFGEHMDALPLYERLEDQILTQIPEVKIKVAKTQITFANKRGFAFVSFNPCRKAKQKRQYHSQLNNITDAPWFCGDTTWYWKENFPHAYEAIYGNYQNNILANIIFVDFQQQGARGLTNAPDEDPDDLSTGYYGSAYRSPENWTTALRSSHFSSAARRGIISDRFVEAILQFWRER